MKTSTAFAALLTAAALTASAAQAGAIVVGGNGLAHSCYVQAAFDDNASSDETVCTAALTMEAMSPRDRASTFVNRGVILGRRGQESNALSDYDHAIAADATLAQAYVDRSGALIALKRYGEAVDSADKGLSLGLAQPEVAYYNRAVAEEGLGKFTAAYYDYKQAVAIAPGFTDASEQLKRFRVVSKPAGGV
jgi:tetratricopeptide (TPR) repeat protein